MTGAGRNKPGAAGSTLIELVCLNRSLQWTAEWLLTAPCCRSRQERRTAGVAPKPTLAPARRRSGKQSSEQRHVNLPRLEVAAAVALASDESHLIWRESGSAKTLDIAAHADPPISIASTSAKLRAGRSDQPA